MKIHEYQAKGILKKYGVAVPRGTMATTREEAEAAAKEILGFWRDRRGGKGADSCGRTRQGWRREDCQVSGRGG